MIDQDSGVSGSVSMSDAITPVTAKRQWMSAPARLYARALEDAYALRMRWAEWLLQIDSDPPCYQTSQVATAACVTAACMIQHPLRAKGR